MEESDVPNRKKTNWYLAPAERKPAPEPEPVTPPAPEPSQPEPPAPPAPPTPPVPPAPPAPPTPPAPPAPPTPPAPPAPVTPAKPVYTSTAQAALNLATAFADLGRVRLSTLDQRMGELRLPEKNLGGWVRVYGGQLQNRADADFNRYKMTYKGLQLGLDKGTSLDGGMAFYGASLDLNGSEATLAQGSGSFKTLTGSLYGLLFINDGLSLSGSLSYGKAKADFTVRDTAGDPVTIKNATAASLTADLELSKDFTLAETEGGRFAIEPQLQLTWRKTDGFTAKGSNGLTVKLDEARSLVGRVGAKISYRGNMTPWNAYVTLSALKEFDGKLSVQFNGGPRRFFNTGDRWFEVSLGAQGRLTDHLSGYLEAGRSFGGDHFKKDWSLTAGLRFDF